MARSLRSIIRETFTISLVPDATEDFQGDQVPQVPTLDTVWESGTAAGQADLVAARFALSIAGSTTINLDLNALAYGPEDTTIAFAEVRAILIRNRSTNGDVIRLDPNTTNGWTALGASFQFDIPVGGYFRLFVPTNGALPVSGSDKVLDVENTDASAATVDICIIGTSA